MLTLTPTDGRFPAVISASGPVSLGDIKKNLRLVAGIHCEFGVIWDMREAELGTLHSRDLKDVAETIAAVVAKESTYPVAIVGSGTLHFGLYRAFQAYAEFAGLKRIYGYFNDPIEASEWIATHLGGNPAKSIRPVDSLSALSA